MELEKNKTAFSIVHVKFPSFSYEGKNHGSGEIKLGINPSGKFYPESQEMELDLAFIAHHESTEKLICSVQCTARFRFEQKTTLEEIPDHFFPNSLGITFPYIRAFLSTLTLQANNSRVLNLGLLNLTGLAKVLRENTITAN